MNDPIELKTTLHRACLDLIRQRIENAQHALRAAEEAGNEETKSSAGDKYETGRAMMQQEQEKNKVQLQHALQLLHEMDAITPDRPCEKVEPGSLVFTEHGIFYIAIGAGKVKLPTGTYFVVSLASPMGAALSGRRTGEVVSFQGKQYHIRQVS